MGGVSSSSFLITGIMSGSQRLAFSILIKTFSFSKHEVDSD